MIIKFTGRTNFDTILSSKMKRSSFYEEKTCSAHVDYGYGAGTGSLWRRRILFGPERRECLFRKRGWR